MGHLPIFYCLVAVVFGLSSNVLRLNSVGFGVHRSFVNHYHLNFIVLKKGYVNKALIIG